MVKTTEVSINEFQKEVNRTIVLFGAVNKNSVEADIILFILTEL